LKVTSFRLVAKCLRQLSVGFTRCQQVRKITVADLSFYEAFRENMTAVGQPCPEQIYGTVQSTVAAMVAMDAYITKYGPRVTVR
jgi:hypothetical protein